jgi:CRISPR-associated endonuclease/helicase Cas3
MLAQLTIAPLSFVIPRHCVQRGEDGLSPLQRSMIEAPERIRIFSAPTGAGKSYAFRRSVDEGARVLFIVPTRRLAQNLARSLIEELAASRGTSFEAAARQVALWTSDERARQRAARPEIRVGHLRVRELVGLEAGDAGDMIIATPESVGFFLLRPDRPLGLGDVGMSQLVSDFDHIVFDEFHAIEARGFGLAATCALIASRIPAGAAKITFLSATPISIHPVLERLGVPADQIRIEAEAVITGSPAATGDARAVHGDVSVAIASAASLADLLEYRLFDARLTLSEGRQVVLVYDSVRTLVAEKERLAAICDRLGVGSRERLAIDSIDDSARGRAHDGLFVQGADHDPIAFRILAATSTIELGVTFQAGMMITDLGFDAASLVQRIGRVAREDKPGTVVVRIDPETLPRKPWARDLLGRLERAAAASMGQVPVERFISEAMAANRGRFDTTPDTETDQIPREFKTLPQRATWCAALFWHVLEEAPNLRRGQRDTLKAFAPRQAGVIAAKLAVLTKSGERAPRRWAERFKAEALRMRLVPPRVRVTDQHGGWSDIPWNIYASHTTLLAAPSWFDDQDHLCIAIEDSLDAVLRSETPQWQEPITSVLFPDRTSPQRVKGLDLADAWLREAKRAERYIPLSASAEASLKAAIDLVRISRLVPTAVDERSDQAISNAHIE